MSYGAPPPPFDPNTGQQPPYGQNPYGQPQQSDPYNPYGQQPGGYQQQQQFPPMGQQPYPQAPPPSPTQGKGGRILGVLAAVGLVVVAIVAKVVFTMGADKVIDGATGADRNKTGEVTEPGKVEPIALKNGDCFQNGVSSETVTETVDNIDAIPCSKAHDAQVVALFSVPGAYPVTAEARFRDLCKAKIEAWVKANPGDYKMLLKLDPKWSFVYLYPKATGWAKGDHQVSCSVAVNSKVLTRKLDVLR